MYQVSRVSGSTWARFERYTFAGLIPLLAQADRNPRVIAFGASSGGEPVGLALAEIDPANPASAELRSIAVAAAHSRLGLGTRLLAGIEDVLARAGCLHVGANYPDDNAAAERIEALFRKAGWNEPRPLRLLCKASLTSLAQAPWTRISYPARFQVFPWRDLTQLDRSEILDRQARVPWFPELLSPFRAEECVDVDVSLGLRLGERVIGWCIGLRRATDTVWVDSLFAGPEAFVRGRAVPLLGAFILRLQGTRNQEVWWQVDRSNKAMLRFNQRHLERWSHSVRSTSRVHKNLN